MIRNCPVGLGEPVFDKLEAELAHAMLSIPATKGFEFGSGFEGCEIPGSTHNDAFVAAPPDAKLRRPDGKTILKMKTNHSGGVQGGITNGEPIYFRVGFKSPATIGKSQDTVTYDGTTGVLEAKGRHDPCVVPRAVPIVEAMAALVVMDMFCAQASREHCKSLIIPDGVSTANGESLKANGHGVEEKASVLAVDGGSLETKE